MATITVGVNSYVTVAEAEAYASDGGYTFVGDVSIMLTLAMRYLNVQKYSGYPTVEGQDLDFPRNGDTEVPYQIEQAQMELAMQNDQGNDPLAPTPRAVKRNKVDVIEVEYMSNASVAPVNSYIDALLSCYLLSNTLTGGNTFEVNLGQPH